jgi:hypothetical protein
LPINRLQIEDENGNMFTVPHNGNASNDDSLSGEVVVGDGRVRDIFDNDLVVRDDGVVLTKASDSGVVVMSRGVDGDAEDSRDLGNRDVKFDDHDASSDGENLGARDVVNEDAVTENTQYTTEENRSQDATNAKRNTGNASYQ